MNTPLSLQDRRVQYAILAIGVIAILVIIFMFVLKGKPAPAPTDTAAFPGAGPGAPGLPGGPGGPGAPGVDVPGGPGAPGGFAPSGGPASYGEAGAPPGYGPPGGVAPGGYAAPSAQASAPRKAGPKPPHRGDPFRDLLKDVDAGNQELYNRQTQEPSMADQLASLGVQKPQLYQTTLAQKRLEDYGKDLLANRVDMGDPPMRMAGVIHGPRVFGILEIAGETRVVRPGETVGPYRVEQVERQRIVLSRPIGSGKRRQVDVPLLDNPNAAQQYGVPGGPGGATSGGGPGGAFPGPPGGFPGGFTPSGG
jgi:hypothetical protein